MLTFLAGTWDKIVQLSVALGVIAAIAMSIYIIATKFGLFSNIIEKRREKHRLETCPQTAVMALYKKQQEIKVEQLHQQLIEANTRAIMLHGSHLVVFCSFMQFRGFMPMYERDWLRKSFKEYKESGGNGGVEDIYKATMLLPECPPRTRSKEDKKED